MTHPKITRNIYCVDPEDRVVPWTCPCCKSCWTYVASKKDGKNGMCPFGGPFEGYSRETADVPPQE